jgi:mannitol-specific phosphotransferase system IIBC component
VGEKVKITIAGSIDGDGFLPNIRVVVCWNIVSRIFVYRGRCTDGNLTKFHVLSNWIIKV